MTSTALSGRVSLKLELTSTSIWGSQRATRHCVDEDNHDWSSAVMAFAKEQTGQLLAKEDGDAHLGKGSE